MTVRTIVHTFGMEFDWDIGNRYKCRKHGLTLEQIEYAMRTWARVAPDPVHSLNEQRFIAISRTPEGRPVFIAFCWRNGRCRPISARYMHSREAAHHDFD